MTPSTLRDCYTANDIRIRLINEISSGITRKDLAHQLGISPQYLHDVINGRREPGESILRIFKLKKVIRYVSKTLLIALLLASGTAWAGEQCRWNGEMIAGKLVEVCEPIRKINKIHSSGTKELLAVCSPDWSKCRPPRPKRRGCVYTRRAEVSMTPEELTQLYIDSIYYSVNSDPPKPRAEVFYEMVREKLVEEHTAKPHPKE